MDTNQWQSPEQVMQAHPKPERQERPLTADEELWVACGGVNPRYAPAALAYYTFKRLSPIALCSPEGLPSCYVKFGNSEQAGLWQYDLHAAYLQMLTLSVPWITYYDDRILHPSEATHALVTCAHGRRLVTLKNLDTTHEEIVTLVHVETHQANAIKVFAGKLLNVYLAAKQADDHADFRHLCKLFYGPGIGCMESAKPEYAKYHALSVARSIKIALANRVHAVLLKHPTIIAGAYDSLTSTSALVGMAQTWAMTRTEG